MTRCSEKRSRYFDSLASSVPESPIRSDSPAASQASLAPCATEAKNGLAVSRTTSPRLLLRPERSCLAAAFLTKPSCSISEVVRCILESLAEAYACAIDAAEALARTAVDTIHVVGGGSQNELLCQLTANRTGRPVMAGPVEATAIGNLLVQARTMGLVEEDASLSDLREIVRRSFPVLEYLPEEC